MMRSETEIFQQNTAFASTTWWQLRQRQLRALNAHGHEHMKRMRSSCCRNDRSSSLIATNEEELVQSNRIAWFNSVNVARSQRKWREFENRKANFEQWVCAFELGGVLFGVGRLFVIAFRVRSSGVRMLRIRNNCFGWSKSVNRFALEWTRALMRSLIHRTGSRYGLVWLNFYWIFVFGYFHSVEFVCSTDCSGTSRSSREDTGQLLRCLKARPNMPVDVSCRIGPPKSKF